MPDLNNSENPTVTQNRFSGLYPDNSYPEVDGQLDMVQEMKLQARQEGARTRRESSDEDRDEHPAFTEKFKTNDHAARRNEAQADTSTFDTASNEEDDTVA